jgi:Fe-S cluster assembly iron-binding protein IscA
MKELIVNGMELKYGSILKVVGLISDSYEEVDTVMLVNNITDGSKYNCKVLDMSTYEIVADFESIEEFVANKQIKILEVVTIDFMKTLEDKIIK